MGLAAAVLVDLAIRGADLRAHYTDAGVLPRADLLTEARALADRLCQGAPLAVRAVKEMAYRGQTLPWVDAVRMGETMRRVALATEDAAEGIAAAREGRRPGWKGR